MKHPYVDEIDALNANIATDHDGGEFVFWDSKFNEPAAWYFIKDGQVEGGTDDPLYERLIRARTRAIIKAAGGIKVIRRVVSALETAKLGKAKPCK